MSQVRGLSPSKNENADPERSIEAVYGFIEKAKSARVQLSEERGDLNGIFCRLS